MKKYVLLKLLLLLFSLDILAGCTSFKQSGKTHWHGKNVHRVEKAYVAPPVPPGTVIHTHGKNIHKLEKTQ